MQIMLNGKHLVVDLPEQFRDLVASENLGALQALLPRAGSFDIDVDMSKVVWADPLPLLSLACVLLQFRDGGTQACIHLGGDQGAPNHRIFLKFLSNQGFLHVLAQGARLRSPIVDKHGVRVLFPDIDVLVQKFGSFHDQVMYQNENCILAKVVSTNDLHARDYVETLINEAATRGVPRISGGSRLDRDRLLQKIRRVYLELIENVIEHAYSPSTPPYFGLYARIRGERAPANRERWDKALSTEKNCCPTLGRFSPNPYSPWLELFFCDVGQGLLCDLENWGPPTGDAELKDLLDRARKHKRENKNPLLMVSSALFRAPLSRVDREGGTRTPITGLQYLGQVLSVDGDFARIYTNGEWAGDVHPWNPDQYHFHLRVRNASSSGGTWYSFSIQPSGQPFQYPSDTWIVMDESAKREISRALIGEEANREALFFDNRDRPDCKVPGELKKDDPGSPVDRAIVLRPPRHLRKQELGAWATTLFGDPRTLPSVGNGCFFLVDLTPFQGMTYAHFLQRIPVQPLSEATCILVSDEWSTCFLTSRGHPGRLRPDLDSARDFSEGKMPIGGLRFGDIAALLRSADSAAFWSARGGREDFYLKGLITWETTEAGSSLSIDGYLDLTQALADPVRYRAAKRALRRLFALYPSLVPLPTDRLITGLIDEARNTRHRGSPQSTQEASLAVGSVYVTGHTAKLYSQQRSLKVMERAFLFVHPSSACVPGSKPLAALTWTPTPEVWQAVVDGEYSRVPGTPFIAKGGAQSISAPRFQPPKYERSYYRRTPRETYDDFRRLGVLKLGHWVYGRAHHLLTVNLGRAFELSTLDNSVLSAWLEEQFRAFFDRPSPTGKSADLLVYPSHSVTHKIVSYFKQGDKPVLPPDRVFAIEFLATRTVSPMRPSPLSADRLRRAISVIRGDGQPRRPCAVLLFDDGVLSAKTIREIIQLLKGLDATNVYTLAIVDRSGLPVQDRIMQSFLEKNPRFWRWDVPTLGSRRECSLCSALARLTDFKFSNSMMNDRINQWLAFFSPRSVENDWERFGITPVHFAEEQEASLGVYTLPDGKIKKHKVQHRDSTSLAAMSVEIARSTARFDYPLRKARQMAAVFGSDGAKAAIEILSSQLFLLFDELDYREKLARFNELISLLWSLDSDSESSALAGICSTLVDGQLAEDLWQTLHGAILKRRIVQTQDAGIAAIVLRSLGDKQLKNTREPEADPPTAEEKFNYLTLFPDRSLVSVLEEFFEVVGENPGRIHVTHLRRALIEAAIWVDKGDPDQATASKDQAVKMSDRLASLLADFHLADFYVGIKDLPDPQKDAKDVKALAESAPQRTAVQSDGDYLTALAEWVKRAEECIFSGTNNISQRYLASFTRRIERGQAVDLVIDAEIRRIQGSWKAIVEEKKLSCSNMPGRWTGPNQEITYPYIACADGGSWDFPSITLVWDQAVHQSIFEVLSNCYHSVQSVGNPLSRELCSPVKSGLADMWWCLKPTKDCIEFHFLNASIDRVMALKPTPAISGLENLGGRVVVSASLNQFGANAFYWCRTVLRVPFVRSLRGRFFQ